MTLFSELVFNLLLASENRTEGSVLVTLRLSLIMTDRLIIIKIMVETSVLIKTKLNSRTMIEKQVKLIKYRIWKLLKPCYSLLKKGLKK